MRPVPLILVTSFLFLTFCAGPQPTIKPDRPEDQPKTRQRGVEQDESFDPMSLGDYEVVEERAAGSSAQAADIDQLLRGDALPDSLKDARKVPGFRVQLIATRDVEEAHALMRNAVISFDDQVYRTFDNPYYKIRVGDYQSRFEANTIQEEAVEKGFLEAWVVRTMVWNDPALLNKDDEDESP